MTATVHRTALCDIYARRELRKTAIPALVLLALALALLTVAASLDGIAHARVSRFESHAYETTANIEKGPRGAYAALTRAPWEVPVVVNDSSEWHSSEFVSVWVDNRNPNDIRIPTETKAFLGGLYDVQIASAVIGALVLLLGVGVAFVWLRRRQILASYPWRWISLSESPRARECVVEPERIRYRARRFALMDQADLEVAGPAEPKKDARSIVRATTSNRMYVVRGPLAPMEVGSVGASRRLPTMSARSSGDAGRRP